MVPSRYSTLHIHDPIQLKLLCKSNIVEDFLKESKDVESYSIGQMLAQLEDKIARFNDVCQRQGDNDPEPKQNCRDRFEAKLRFAYSVKRQTTNRCRTASEASIRRNMLEMLLR